MTWLDRSLITGPYLALVTSEKAFKKALAHLGLKKSDGPNWIKTPQADATTHWMDHKDGSLACIVALRLKPSISGIQVASLLAHEAVHVFQKHCEHIGECRPSMEFEAYSIQAITQTLLCAYADQTGT